MSRAAIMENHDASSSPDFGKAARMPDALTLKQALLLLAGAIVAFQLAYSFATCSFLIAIYLWCLFQLTRLKTSRLAFYFGLAAGVLCGAPQSGFLWNIFGAAAIPLWLILAFWVGLFVHLGRNARLHFGSFWGVMLIPFLWTGLEYFRSELYYLRFSWLNVGYVFAANTHGFPIRFTGMYGIGFLIMGAIAATALLQRKQRLISNMALLVLLAILTNVTNHRESNLPANDSRQQDGMVQVAGVQMEFPSDQQVIWNLDKLLKKYPEAQLLLLSEYTFNGPLPEQVKKWCQEHQRYLVVGAKDLVSDSDYYDTAFVIGPTGEIVFRQGKCVPIQFFKDGLPAKEQKLWDSPWGKIGFCVCYDLSYTRVTDQLIRLGAQAIIVPTMDVVEWGRHQHELHARVAPTRVTEYGVPIFRLASSGISQFVDGTGVILATAPMPGDEAVLSAPLHLAAKGSLPWDRYIAPLAVLITGLLICWCIVRSVTQSKKLQPKQT
jgi:apolipoprotein N-acyltransferase